MVENTILNVNGKAVQGIRIIAPGGEGHPNMIVILCEKGYIMCGYLNLETSNAVSDAAAVVGGATFDEILANPVKAVSKSGEAAGIKVGMSGAEAVAVLS